MALEISAKVFQYAEKLGYHFTLVNVGGGFSCCTTPADIDQFQKQAASVNKGLQQYFAGYPNLKAIGEPGVCLCVCVHVCVYMHMFSCVRAHVCVYACVCAHVCVYVCTCSCVHAYVHVCAWNRPKTYMVLMIFFFSGYSSPQEHTSAVLPTLLLCVLLARRRSATQTQMLLRSCTTSQMVSMAVLIWSSMASHHVYHLL